MEEVSRTGSPGHVSSWRDGFRPYKQETSKEREAFRQEVKLLQMCELLDSGHDYDPFHEDEPRACSIESFPKHSIGMRSVSLDYGFQASFTDYELEELQKHSFRPMYDVTKCTILAELEGGFYDPVRADTYWICKYLTIDIGEYLTSEMGRVKRKWRALTCLRLASDKPRIVRVDSMEDTLNKLKKPEKPIQAKPMTLTIPKSSTMSSIGSRDGDKTPSGAFRPIKSDPELGNKEVGTSAEVSTQCKVGRTETFAVRMKGYQFRRQHRIMSMPEPPSKGKLKKLQSQLSAVFRKRESYPHDETYTRYSRKRYVSSSSSSSDTSPLVTSIPSSPESDQNQDNQGQEPEMDIDIEEIEKEASELESEGGSRWVQCSDIWGSHSLIQQSSQEEFTETDDWVMSPSGEFLYIESTPSIAVTEAPGNPAYNTNLNDGSADECNAALSVESEVVATSFGIENESASEPQLQICNRTPPQTVGTMNNENQISNDPGVAVNIDTLDTGKGNTSHVTAHMCILDTDDSNGNGEHNPTENSHVMLSGGISDMVIGADVDINVQECVKRTLPTSEELNNNAACPQEAEAFRSDIITGQSPTSDNASTEDQVTTSTTDGQESRTKCEDTSPMDHDTSNEKSDNSPSLDDSGNKHFENEGETLLETSASDPERTEREDYTQHIGASLVNNTLAIMLLIDHKLASGSFKLSTDDTGDGISQYEGPEDEDPDGGIDEVQFRYQDPDENLEEDHLLMAKTYQYMRRQHQDQADLDRSKSFGNSVSKAFNEAVSKLEMGHESRNRQFHKLFPCVPDTESVINTYSCALVKDILLQGRLFVSENWICFHSNIFTYEKQLAIRVETITKLTKERTAFVVPNAIGIHTTAEKYIFGSLLSRHSTHQLLYQVWKNIKGEIESMSAESSLLGESDEDIPDDSDEIDGLGLDHEGRNGGLHPTGSAQDRLDPSSSEQLCNSQSRHGSPRLPRLSPDLPHCMSDYGGTGRRSHTGYHRLCQRLCSVSIFKSIMRLGSSLKQLPQYQPFLLLIGILLLCLTFSAAVLSVRIWQLQPQMTPDPLAAASDSVHLDSMEKIGNLFLKEQHKHQEKVIHIQDTLTANLKALLQVQSSLRKKSHKDADAVTSESSATDALPWRGKDDL